MKNKEIIFDKFGDERGMNYFDSLKERKRCVVATYDYNHRSDTNRHGIKTRFKLPHWDGGPLYYNERLKRLVEKGDSPSGFVKSLILTSGHTNFGGQIFVEGWWKNIIVWAYKVEWIPTPPENSII